MKFFNAERCSGSLELFKTKIIEYFQEFDKVSPLKNEGSMMQTCRNINVHVQLTQIYVETCMNVYGLHKKADLSMCTA